MCTSGRDSSFGLFAGVLTPKSTHYPQMFYPNFYLLWFLLWFTRGLSLSSAPSSPESSISSQSLLPNPYSLSSHHRGERLPALTTDTAPPSHALGSLLPQNLFTGPCRHPDSLPWLSVHPIPPNISPPSFCSFLV